MQAWAFARDKLRAEAHAWLIAEAAAAGVQLEQTARDGLCGWLADRVGSCSKSARELGEPAEFPVVARLIESSVTTWRQRMRGLLAHVARDAALLGSPPLVTQVKAHGERLQARTTTLGLELAPGVRWFYRTRDRSQGAWFQEVCAALNVHGLSVPLHVRRLVLRDGCSWDEHVDAHPCSDPAAIERYFIRAGMLVRLVERLCGDDLHARNVMMAGEYPVLVDVETLFVPVPPMLPPSYAALHASPIRSGLVGVVMLGRPGRHGIDASGLNPGGLVELPEDDEDGPIVDELARTIPAPLGDHVDDVLAGWTEMDELLSRADLSPVLAPLLARVPQLQRRSFGVPGNAYHAALVASLAPDLLRSEAARDAWIATLGFAPAESAGIRDLILVRRMEPVGDHPAASLTPPFTDAERRRRHDILHTAIALRDDRPCTPSSREVSADRRGLAIELGDRLLALRFADARWHGVPWVPTSGLRIFGVTDASLDGGIGGIALVLALLARATGEVRFADAARAALAHVPDDTASLGVFGLGGAIYALASCGLLLDDQRLLHEARTYVAAAPRIEAPWDVPTGVAGFVLGASAIAPPPPAAVTALHHAWPHGLGGSRVLSAGGVPACMPDEATGVACALARGGVTVSPPADGALAWRIALDPAATGIEPSAPLDRLDVHLARYRATRAPEHARAIRDCADALVERARTTGRWFPETSIAERHQLGISDGIPGVIHALLAAEDPDVRSIRRLEPWLPAKGP